MRRPEPSEAAPYYSRYIDLVPGENILETLTNQLDETHKFLNTISEEQSVGRYAPDKWTIKQVLNHVNDAERIFVLRALWFARGFQDPLPGFDQDTGVAAAAANEVSWKDHVDEFRNVRRATLSLLNNLPHSAWSRSGVASENLVTVRALAYIIAGHVLHHQNVVRERYL